MGTDKMVKLVIGTSILFVIILGRSGLLQTWNYYLIQMWADGLLLGISQPTLLTIVQSIDSVTGVLIFLSGMVVMMKYTYLDIAFDNGKFSPQAQQLLLIPLSLFSLIVGLTVAVIGIDVFSPTKLYALANILTRSFEFQTLIRYLPFCVMLQGAMSLFLVSSLDFGFGERKTVDPLRDDKSHH
jgi:hypothetical protein